MQWPISRRCYAAVGCRHWSASVRAAAVPFDSRVGLAVALPPPFGRPILVAQQPARAQDCRRDPRSRTDRAARGYTLVEILVATALSLMLMAAVVRMFGDVSQGIADSRSMLEAADRLRLAATRLQQDLSGVTVTMSPPRKPENNEGYFEYIEGPVVAPPSNVAYDPALKKPADVAFNTSVIPASSDTTAGDFDDILMFTTRSAGRPFVGRYLNGLNGVGQSDVAEVAWFLRGRTLHRRVLLVMPGADVTTGVTPANFYQTNDISVRVDGTLKANTLGDLTRRECRFAHPTTFPTAADGCYWYWTIAGAAPVLKYPTLPTLAECSTGTWAPNQPVANTSINNNLDFWRINPGYFVADNALAPGGTRVADDVILTNVIGFDVKAWDPGAGAYVDLGYNNAGATTAFSGFGDGNSGLQGTANTARIYDTYSTSLEADVAHDGFDNGNGVAGIVDDDGEKVQTGGGVTYGLPPYAAPLRGVQVKIRVFEPDSRQIREVTVVQDFLSQ
jgi:type II secretory pathway pseudopilin PulG